MDLLREDLWLYGWKCLSAWTKDGTIIEKCGERGIAVPARWFEVEALKRRGELRDEVVHAAVEYAVRTFTEEYLRDGRWDPDKGATMRTYFLGTCMYAFRDAFRSWAGRYRRNLFSAADPLVQAELYAPYAPYGDYGYYGSYEDTTVFQETVRRIMENAGPEVRAICGCIWEAKMTHKEIGDELGISSRAVEGHMRRLRARATSTRWGRPSLLARRSPPSSSSGTTSTCANSRRSVARRQAATGDRLQRPLGALRPGRVRPQLRLRHRGRPARRGRVQDVRPQARRPPPGGRRGLDSGAA